MRRFAISLMLLTAGCVGALQGGLPIPAPVKTVALWHVDVVAVDPVGHGIAGASIGLHTQACADPTPTCYVFQPANADGYALFTVTPDLVSSDVIITAQGYQTFTAHLDVAGTHDGQAHNIFTLTPLFPPPPTRAEILNAHESFQGAILTTSCFGALHWWPTAFSSLSASCREEAYPQIASWGDTDITVSASWNYGEAGQPYGTGQLVPNTDFLTPTNRLVSDFRPLVKEVIQHKAANGRPFIPRIFMEGDNGYLYYLWAMPQIIAALRPQPGDPIDLTPYVKLQMCYDSCVPGYAGSNDDKSLINDAILKTRALCPSCVIALEFSTGYASTGDGDGWWQTDAAKGLDEIDWEGNSWPISNFDQYWQVLDRWLGPAFVRPPQMPELDDPNPPYYLRNGTPRGPFGVQCLEPYTYQWVRSQVDLAQVPIAFAYLKGLGCPVIDTPQF